jgi:alanine dehydrogenase
MALLLRERDVTELLDMRTTLEAVEEALRDQGGGRATNRPRQRVAMPSSQLHILAAGDRRLNVFGFKAYTVSKKGARFLVMLYEADSGDLLAMIEADRLGQMRTGAASGVATKYMARDSADTVGIYGTGWQAESQLMAVCAVKKIKTVKAYGRDRARREAFARKMSSLLRCEVTAVDAPEEAARGCYERARAGAERRVGGAGRARQCCRVEFFDEGRDRRGGRSPRESDSGRFNRAVED